MSFTEWLLQQLVDEGVIEEDDYDAETVDKQTLLDETSLDEEDLNSYYEQYLDFCSAYGYNASEAL